MIVTQLTSSDVERFREMLAAIAFYGKLGTREDVLHFDIPVN